jgi:hypothetical protein
LEAVALSGNVMKTLSAVSGDDSTPSGPENKERNK